ncbi:stearoyl-CoA desaturase (delta-9 desaturase) [Streptomyces sp. TLI_235]|nr:stearoyl-CoA desaturase (delta-9 desaturase) [Streptomyces sp. TLI_235]
MAITARRTSSLSDDGTDTARGSTVSASAPYDGVSPFPRDESAGHDRIPRWQMAVTAVVVAFPFIALAAALRLLWGSLVGPTDVILAVVLYCLTGLGVTVGFHRGLTHGSFTPNRPMKIAMAIAGSMSFQGDVITWVATHRRHHAYTDRPGDPHSPFRFGTSLTGELRGLLHAHIGWLFTADVTPPARYAPDLLADPDLRAVSRAFPALCLLSLALPLAVGAAVGGTWHAALTALIWAGLIRVALLQHVTWSVNSLCHMIGRRPFRTRRHDRATNLWPLALLSFGESWHNLHHADPTCARHGVDRGQIDPTAAVIHLLERTGWVHDVRWPVADRLETRRQT